MLAEFVSVRQAGLGDAQALAEVFSESWLLAYRGIIPHNYLSTIVARRGVAWWRENLRRPGGMLVLEAGGKAAGYATFGPSRMAGRPRGEIYELYLGPHYQGLGLGERLFESARQRLDDLRLDGLLVWALSDNHAACDFYWRRGGLPVQRGTERFGNKSLPKTGFGWD
jgi:ribosomal protein S18 acetylase RimI-like enzyme